jgi:murein DD-endopeptidase MepM/ murein hydrolase activator NlpD
MSGDLLQSGHRAQAARRYRRDAEGLDAHTAFGGATSFGGFTATFDTYAPAPVGDHWGAADSGTAEQGWNGPEPAGWDPAATESSWGAPGSDTVRSSPADSGWDAPDSEGSWSSPVAEQDWNTWSDEPEPDAEPFNLADLGAPAQGAGRAGRAATRRAAGAHRMPAPPTALKGRAAVIAVAAGAVVAAGQAGLSRTAGADHQPSTAEAAGQIREVAQTVATGGLGGQAPQTLDIAPVTDLRQFEDVLHHGQQFAADLASQAQAKLRPLYVRFANGAFTSGYGSRWGVLHPGVDIAAPIGTPIYAVMDGTVISAGPASGFGMWVRIRHDDGTMTVYGHVNTATVHVGERVMAGDQIATIGNRGFSTGPHCHFEVWLHGTDRIDPLPWLASRGISLGPEED